MSKVKNPSTSDVKQGHKRKGGGSKPHSSRGRIGTATIKKNVDASARRANQRVAGANTKPKTKPASPKVPTISGPKAKPARRPTMQEQRDAGASVIVDYEQLNKMSEGGLIGGQKKLDANKDGKISGEDFAILRGKKKNKKKKMVAKKTKSPMQQLVRKS